MRRLRGDRGGAAAVELAVLLPVLTFALLGAVDVANVYSAKLALVQAAGRALELATAPATAVTNYDYLRAEAAAAAGQAQDDVTVDTWLECNGQRQNAMTSTCTAGQQIGRYVSVAVAAAYEPRFNWGWLIGNGGASVPIMGSATVRVQ